MIKVSILVPVYKVENYIEKCARSLLACFSPHIEYIFVDDASPDNSIRILEEILKDYPDASSNVSILRHKSNRGLAAARNTAVAAAKGEYILHVDSDDWLAPNAIETLLKIAEDRDADIVVSDFKEVRKDGSSVWKNPHCSDSEEFTKSLLRRKSLTHIIGKLIRRNVLIENDLWAIEGINQGEDYLLTPRIAYFSRKIAYADLPLYCYNRMNCNSYTANVSEKGIDSIIEVQRRLVEFFSGIPEAEAYESTLKESCIYNKLSCFYSAPLSAFPKIAALYSDIDWKQMNLKKIQKFILSLSDLGLLRFAYTTIAFGKRLR